VSTSTTGISWTEATWNPVHGCDRVSHGCDNCYALTMANRLKGMGHPTYQQDGNPATSGPGFAVTLVPNLLHQPLRWTKPRRVFVDSMGDLFHATVPTEYIAKVFAVMAATPHHTYQLLTKRHGRMYSLLTSPAFASMVHEAFIRLVEQAGLTIPRFDTGLAFAQSGENLLNSTVNATAMEPLPNLWLGVSIEDQKTADLRLPTLLETPAAVRWISAEPLLGYVRLRNALCPGSKTFGYGHDAYTRHDGCCPHALDGLHWVVVGGESGTGARPMHPKWASSLAQQAVDSNIPLHFKQWGEWGPMPAVDGRGAYVYRNQTVLSDTGTQYTAEEIAYPEGPRYGEAIRANENRHYLTNMYRLGRRTTGRKLGDDIWDQYPGDTPR
jgi:protein gp37